MHETDFNDMVARGETPNVDFKKGTAFSGDVRPSLAVDIAAMSNTRDGGTIIVGVSEQRGERVVDGVTSADLPSWDPTNLGKYLRRRLSPPPRVSIEHHHTATGVVVVLVQIAEFDEVPLVVCADIATSANKKLATEGDLLVRSPACESIRVNSVEGMRSVIGLAMSKQSGRLLEDFKAVLDGRPTSRFYAATGALGESGVDETFEAKFRRMFEGWAAYEDRVSEAADQAARYSVRLLYPPTGHDLHELIALVRAASTEFRGWDFPHDGSNDMEYYDGWGACFTNWRHHREAWAVTEAGAFASTGAIWQDLMEPGWGFNHPPVPARIVDFVNLIYQFTEFLAFATRFLNSLGVAEFQLEVGLVGLKGRRLGAFEPGLGLRSDQYVARQDEFWVLHQGVVSVLDSEWKSLAIEWSRRVFTVFQWPNSDRQMVQNWQQKLLERRL